MKAYRFLTLAVFVFPSTLLACSGEIEGESDVTETAVQAISVEGASRCRCRGVILELLEVVAKSKADIDQYRQTIDTARSRLLSERAADTIDERTGKRWGEELDRLELAYDWVAADIDAFLGQPVVPSEGEVVWRRNRVANILEELTRLTAELAEVRDAVASVSGRSAESRVRLPSIEESPEEGDFDPWLVIDSTVMRRADRRRNGMGDLFEGVSTARPRDALNGELDTGP